MNDRDVAICEARELGMTAFPRLRTLMYCENK